MSDHLTAGQRALLTGILESRRETVRQQLLQHQQGRSRVDHARALLSEGGDDEPQQAAEREVDLALSDNDVVEMAALDEALIRVGQTGYGLCSDCGAAIPFDRLRIEPQALRCVPCASEYEKVK